jgi:myo-inositol-1(or 4)-monophosphatase
MDKQLCEEVISVAQKTGAFIQQSRKHLSAKDIELKGLNDLVSFVDREAEKLIVECLRPLLPDAGFLAEENTVEQQQKKLLWIIDPLDGTTNYLHGVPCYSVSIALLDNNKPVLGVVHEINLHETFYAWKDSPSFLNGKEISVSKVSQLKDALIATGFPYTNYSRLKEYMQVFDYCMKNTHGLRRPGSAAVDLAYTAAGRYDAFFEYGLNAWDVAAGAFIVQQAKGCVTDFSGKENFIFGKEILAANPLIFESFLEVIRKHFNP